LAPTMSDIVFSKDLRSVPYQPGASPQENGKGESGLKARAIPCAMRWFGPSGLNLSKSNAWGDAPGRYGVAPLALKAHFRKRAMFMGNTIGLALAFVFFSALASLLADEAIPASLQKERYDELWMNSPFTRSLNVAANYVMTGMARIDNKPVVSLRNTATGERFSLSTEKNALGWRLLSIRTHPIPRNVVARISVGEDEMTVRFDDEQITEKALIKGAMGGVPASVRPVPMQSGTSRKLSQASGEKHPRERGNQRDQNQNKPQK